MILEEPMRIRLLNNSGLVECRILAIRLIGL
jgi:hypothetical protein